MVKATTSSPVKFTSFGISTLQFFLPFYHFFKNMKTRLEQNKKKIIQNCLTILKCFFIICYTVRFSI
ncbi:bacteriorhodopsin [Streptococcus mitis]|uniref:bacteriorhodopsin n=1 Tax=Streptococcus mitis TaxID=28037 RepID=UPI0034D96A5F